ncbi:SDR family oxidoreductase [Blastomonas sp.]|uniref:SDR family oxidoreductase n=1 Tax=Blastomonas sp. TaxID=1909299 RepID=UPI0035938EA7
MGVLKGRKILVMGGSRGIGAAIVRRLAADGGRVTFTYAGSKDAADALASETGSTALQADSVSRDAVIAAVRAVSPVDILVISAGVFVYADIREGEADVIDRMIDLNVRAPYHASAEAAKTMPDGGRIIIIGSVNADAVPVTGASGYAMTKAAMQGLARGMARDLGPKGITVNVVQPGPVATDMNPEHGDFADALRSFMAIPRYARPEEIAGMVAYLAGPEAGIVTGAMHTIDGGFAC